MIPFLQTRRHSTKSRYQRVAWTGSIDPLFRLKICTPAHFLQRIDNPSPHPHPSDVSFHCLVTTIAFAAMAGEVTAGEIEPQTRPIHENLLRFEEEEPSNWGVGMGLRFTNIPFKTRDKNSSDIYPTFYYDGDLFFMAGKEGGVKLWQDDRWGLNAIGRYRFFDIPREFQNQIRGDELDVGLQAYYMLGDWGKLEGELLTDFDGRLHAIARLSSEYHHGRWSLYPHLELLAKSERFNTRNYGLDLFEVDAGVELRGRVQARYHVWKELHLEGAIEAGLLDSNARNSPLIEDDFEWEFYLGFGFFEEREKKRRKEIKAKPYFRLAQGWGTSSTMGEIISGEFETEDVDVNMTSLFYGHPLSDTLFGLPIEVFLTTGVIHHYASSAQSSATEGVVGIKMYYTIPLPWRVRIGAAEGISYTSSVTYYERTSMQQKNLETSKLLNYLDFTVDLNLGDVFKAKVLQDAWLGVGIHHRSGIFESSSAFGRISGGSNWGTIYFQWSNPY